MGRAASSCLKIMACGGRGPAREDEAAAPEPADAKSPQDKAKWNFLLRSSRNQVTNNNIAVSGPLASVPEKDEDSEASNKGSSPQPEQATGKVRMMKFAEFVPKLSFHLTETEPLDAVSEKDGATDSDPPHQKSKSSDQLPVQNNADESYDTSKTSEQLPLRDDADGSNDTSNEPKASAAPLSDADHSVEESVFVQSDSKESVLSLHNSEASSPAHDSADVDHSLIRESAALKIQAAVRAYLAELALKKHKNVIKLQAAARGYLVRREAVSTLRCVQAILKMQSLVRARRVHHNLGKLDKKEPLEAIVQEAEGLYCLEKESSALCLSNEKLLKNGFVVQLLESTPRSKRIYISCEPSRSDSAWRWLERWMTVISSDPVLQQEPSLGTTHHVQEETAELRCSEEFSEVPASVHLPETVLCHPEPTNTVNDNVDSGNVIDCHATISTGEMTELRGLEELSEVAAAVHLPETVLCHPDPNITVKDDGDGGDVLEYHPSISTGEQVYEAEEHSVDSDSESADELNCNKLEMQKCSIELEPTTKKNECEIEDDSRTNEADKKPEAVDCTSEMIESNNAEFAAEQIEVKSLSVEDASCLPCLSVSSQAEVPEEKEPVSIAIPSSYSSRDAENLYNENADPPEPITYAASESDSETSVSSSSSGSPDSSESESEGVAFEKGDAEFEEKQDANNISAGFGQHENENHEESPSTALLEEDIKIAEEKLSPSAHEHTQSKSPVEPTAPVEQDIHNDDMGLPHIADGHTKSDMSTEPTALDMQDVHENDDSEQAYSLSPEQSPSHHIIEANSYETPPNEVPTNNEDVNGGDGHANMKQSRSEPRSKRSLSEMKDAPSDSKTDQSTVDSKITKRRQSTGTVKPDNGGPRTGSNNSLPSYMQATESARAKVHASVSPKSSPDLKDNNRKKKLSLPAGGEKQNSSPRMQRSGSQVHQNPKINGMHAPLNFSERRWQR